MDGHPIIKDRTGGSVQRSARQLAAGERSGLIAAEPRRKSLWRAAGDGLL